MSTKYELSEVTQNDLLPGFKVRFIHSETMTQAFWEIDKDAELPEHSHVHEQVVHVLEGEFELVVEGESYLMKPGEVLVISSNAKHSGKAITDCRIHDAFSPVREDYQALP